MNALEVGKSKLVGHIQLENLPKDRNDILWVEIRSECGLTLDEVSALKNEVCINTQRKFLMIIILCFHAAILTCLCVLFSAFD